MPTPADTQAIKDNASAREEFVNVIGSKTTAYADKFGLGDIVDTADINDVSLREMLLHEMVGRVDEENRLGRKKKQSVRYEKPEVRDEKEKRRFVVEVEKESASSADRQAGDEKQETRDEEEPKLTFESLKKKRMESEADMVRQEEIGLKEGSLIDQFQLEQFKKQSLKKEEIIQKQEVGVQKEENKIS